MAETRARDLAKSLGQAVRTNNIASDGSLAVLGVTAYDSSGALPTSYDSNNAGSLGFAKDSDRLYVHTGQGWFNIAIVNTTPYFTTTPSASYTLATDATAAKNGTATTITIAATDSEGFPITYNATGNSAFNNIAYVDKDSAAGFIFTVEPKSQDSVGEATPAAGTLTFTATDGINIASAASTFSLTFDTSISESEYTSMLVRGIGNNQINETIADDSPSNHTIAVHGINIPSRFITPLSPYSSVGYSAVIGGLSPTADGGTADQDGIIKIPSHADFAFGAISGTSNDFTVELWCYLVDDGSSGNKYMLDMRGGGNNDVGVTFSVDSNLGFRFFPGGNYGLVMEGPKINYSQWYHVAVVRSGNTTTFYINGSPWDSHTNDLTYVSTGDILVGSNRGALDQHWRGYLHDVRFTKGTAVYTAAFTPPTSPLAVTSATSAIACSTPYGRGYLPSKPGGAKTVTVTEAAVLPFTPYKTKAVYNPATGVGSLNQSNNFKVAASADFTFGSSTDFTVEFWYNNVSNPNVPSWHQTFIDFRNGSDTHFKIQRKGPYHYVSTGSGANNTNLTDFLSDTSDSHLNYGWVHVAYTRASGTHRLFVNGIQRVTSSTSKTYGSSNSPCYIGYDAFYLNQQYNRMSQIRVIKGTAAYTGNFYPPTGALTTTGGTYRSLKDPTNDSTTTVDDTLTASECKLLINFNDHGVMDFNQGQGKLAITDRGTSSGNSYDGPKSSTAQQKYSVPSILFDASDEQYIEIGNHDTDVALINALKSENYTLEMYVRFNGTPALNNGVDPTFFQMGMSGTTAIWDYLYCDISRGNKLSYYHGGQYSGLSAFTLDHQSALSADTWHHIALVRNRSTVDLFVDGVKGTSSASHAGMLGGGATHAIGGRSYHFESGSYTYKGFFEGYLSMIRITKRARYPFIPLTETVTTTTSFQSGITVGNSGGNVKLLCGHTSTYAGGNTNRLTDGSDTGHTIYNNGIAISSWAPSGSMSSLYFERASGTPDYFNIDAHADFLLDGDFTIDFWIYATGYAVHDGKNQRILIMDRNSGNVANNFQILLNDSNGTIYLWGGTSGTLQYQSNTANVADSRWHHVAVVRNGSSSGNLSTFVDGTLDTATTYTNSINANGRTTLRPSLGTAQGGGGGFQGYISNFRIIKGQALYTQNFTPPGSAITG